MHVLEYVYVYVHREMHVHVYVYVYALTRSQIAAALRAIVIRHSIVVNRYHYTG